MKADLELQHRFLMWRRLLFLKALRERVYRRRSLVTSL